MTKPHHDERYCHLGALNRLAAPFAPDHVPDLQREVQRLMGQNILRLQLYKQQLKRIMAATDFGVEIPAAGEPRQMQGIQTNGKTLGQLLGELLVSELPPPAPDTPEAPDVAVRFHTKLRLHMPPSYPWPIWLAIITRPTS